MDSALKAYSSFSKAPEIRFKERRLFIRMHLPTLSGYDVQKRIEGLNDDLSTLNNEIAECQAAILQLRQGKDPESIRREFGVFWSLSQYSQDIIGCFKDEISSRKKAALWIRRERAIYLWELRPRKIGGLKLPLIRHRLDALNKEASGIVVALRGHAEQMDGLLEGYQRVSSETSELQAKVRKLSLDNQMAVSQIPEVPAQMKEINQKYLQELNRVCAGAN